MRNRPSIALGFLALIAIGAALLAAPFSRVAGTWGSPMTALFTAASAVCVTGLTVVDVGTEFTRAGQIVLMVFVQLGCLSLMTLGTFLMVAIGRRLSLASEFSIMNAYGTAAVRGLKGLVCWVIGSMLVIEASFAAALYPVFHDWYLACFYSVMSFCNAGFGVLPGSLESVPRSWPLAVMGLETVLGGIGFLVLYNLCTFAFRRRAGGGRGRLTLHTKVVLRMTLWLLLLAYAAFLLLEWNGALAAFPVPERWTVALYQAITPRTCGFAVVPTETLRPLTRLVYELLMFIGGAPGSAAAGIKVTTLAVLIYTLTAMCRGDSETIISQRMVPTEIVRESLVIFTALAAFIAVTFGALLVTEAASGISSDRLFFEAVSAITTTGLSLGDTTRSLSSSGRVVIMIAMFIGRLGALTVVMMIGDRELTRRVRFPTEELVVG